LIQESVFFGRIQFHEIKPGQIDFCDKNLSESMNNNSFNYDKSKNNGFLIKLILSFLLAVPVIYAEEQK
jgi:hypothetical protein